MKRYTMNSAVLSGTIFLALMLSSSAFAQSRGTDRGVQHQSAAHLTQSRHSTTGRHVPVTHSRTVTRVHRAPVAPSRSVYVEVGRRPAPTHYVAAPTHYVAAPTHVSGPSLGYLRDVVRDAEYDVDRAADDVRGADNQRVSGYLRSAEGYLDQAERLLARSPYRYGYEIEEQAELARDYASRARTEARRYEGEVIELSRTAQVELRRLTDDNGFYRNPSLRVEVQHLRDDLERAQDTLRIGQVTRAHAMLDDVMRGIRNAERDLNQYGYFRERS